MAIDTDADRENDAYREANRALFKDPTAVDVAKFILSLPDKDPLGDIENMRRNLERALSCAKSGQVVLYEAEIKHWITKLDEFLQIRRTKGSGG